MSQTKSRISLNAGKSVLCLIALIPLLFISSVKLQAQLCNNPVVDLGPDIIQCGGSTTLDAGDWGGGMPGPGGIDQNQTSFPSTLAMFAQGDLAQSFTPTQATICGGSLVLDPFSGTGTADITISLYTDLPNNGGVLLASATAFGMTPGSVAAVSWARTPVTPGQTYYLVFTSSDLTFAAAGDIIDSYPGGFVYANPGYQPFPDFDYAFETYYCTGWAYEWSDGSVGQTLNVTTAGTYSVTVTEAPTCSTTSSVNVTIAPAPVVDLGADIVHCNTNFRDILFVTVPDSAYAWSTGETTQQIAVTTPGTYSVTVTNGDGCSVSSDINISIQPSLVVNLGAATQSSCSSPIPLNAAGPFTSWKWSDGSTSPFLLATTSGTYTVSVADAYGCTGSGAVNVQINPLPVLGPNVTDSICPLGTADLNSYYITQGMNVNYGVANPNAVPAGIYPITVTDQNGCQATANITINTRQAPNLGADVNDGICPFTTIDLTSYFNTSSATFSYLHSDNIPVATPHSVGADNYLVIATANGCSDTASVNITLDPKPNLGADRTDSLCANSISDLTVLIPDNGYSTYNWNTQNPIAASPGTYTLIVSNSAGCTDTALATIKSRQQPVVTLNMPDDICFNTPPFPLTAGSPAGGTYYINGNVATEFNTGLLGLTIPPHVVYVYTNASGCTDSAVKNIIIRPQPFITTTMPPALCLTSTPIDLDTYFDISAGGSPGTHHYSGLGVSSHFFYPSLVPNSSPVQIQDVYIDIYGCIDTSRYNVTVRNPVNVSLISTDESHSICEGQEVTFTAMGADSFYYYVNGQPVQQKEPTDPTYTTSSLQDKDIVIVVGKNVCSSDTSDPYMFDVHPLPFVDAGPDTTISLGTSIQLSGDARGDDLVMYEWRPTTNLNFPTLPNPTFDGSDSVMFYFYATDAYGCMNFDSVMISVVVPDSIVLPNVITPDGDGKNDAWKIHERVDLTGSNLVIFNRWGTKVYEVTSYANDWMGTNKSGEKVPDGTYYYVLRVPSQNNHVYRGAINVLNSQAK